MNRYPPLPPRFAFVIALVFLTSVLPASPALAAPSSKILTLPAEEQWAQVVVTELLANAALTYKGAAYGLQVGQSLIANARVVVKGSISTNVIKGEPNLVSGEITLLESGETYQVPAWDELEGRST